MRVPPGRLVIPVSEADLKTPHGKTESFAQDGNVMV